MDTTTRTARFVPVPIARAEALFASPVHTGTTLTRVQADTAIRVAVRACRGVAGCGCHLAYRAGDDPTTAAARMRWARDTVDALYPPAAHPHRPPALRMTIPHLRRVLAGVR